MRPIQEEQQGTLEIFKEGAYEKSDLNWTTVGCKE